MKFSWNTYLSSWYDTIKHLMLKDICPHVDILTSGHSRMLHWSSCIISCSICVMLWLALTIMWFMQLCISSDGWLLACLRYRYIISHLGHSSLAIPTYEVLILWSLVSSVLNVVDYSWHRWFKMVISLPVNKSLISPLYFAHVAVRSGVVMNSICSLSCEYRSHTLKLLFSSQPSHTAELNCPVIATYRLQIQ